MATTLKVLGQIAPSATTLTTLYAVPSATSAVCSTLVVCNRSSTATSFRVAVRPAGASISNEHYIYYDVAIAGNDTFCATIGISLATTDVVSVYATLATLSFSLFGQQVT
jgi:glucose-6-phosphate dehydrogenase assembly protein OpcA